MQRPMGAQATWLAALALLACLATTSALFPKRTLRTGQDIANVNDVKVPMPWNLASRYRRPHNLVVNKYDIWIKPYVKAPGVTYDSHLDGTFDGSVTISFTMQQDAFEVTLDALQLQLISIRLEYNSVPQQLVSANYNTSADLITVRPVSFLRAGKTYFLSLTYSGLIYDFTHGGLFYSPYNDVNGQVAYVYATHFETGYGARSVFPCFDDPHFKAVFNLTVVAPSNWTIVANTLETIAVPVGNGYTSVHFSQTPKMSNYLLAFAFGDFVSQQAKTFDGKLVRAFTWRRDAPFLEQGVQTLKTCTEVMTNYTGISLPLDKLDNVGLPTFPAGAMENWGLILGQNAYVVYDPTQDLTKNLIDGIDVSCHEISHQWFGDLVTADWWSDIMLHESFAAYFENLALSLGWPAQAKFWDSMTVGDTVEGALNADTKNSHPIITTDGSFDGIVYAKGASVLRMLSATITPSIFQDGLRNYLNKYKFSTADHNMMFAAITEEVAKYPKITDWCFKPLNVSKFMNPWVLQPHYPMLTVTLDKSASEWVVNQQPFYPRGELPQGYNYNWPVPFLARQAVGGRLKQYWSAPSFICGPSAEEDEQKYNLPGIRIPSTGSAPLIVNSDSNTFARVEYDDETFEKIHQGLLKNTFTLSDNALVRLINDELAIFRKNVDLGRPASYIRSLKIVYSALRDANTDSAAVFLAARKLLDEMYSLSVEMEERGLYNEYFGQVLTGLYSKVNWTGATTDWNQGRLRSELLLFAVLNNIGDARARAMAQFSNLYSNCKNSSNFVKCNTLPTDVRAAVYCGAVMQSESVYKELKGFLDGMLNIYSPNHQEAQNLIQGMSCTTDKISVTLFVALALTNQQTSASDLMKLTTNPLASDVLYTYVTTHFNTVALRPNGFYYALQAMAHNWFTKDRLSQFRGLGLALSNQMSAAQKTIYTNVLTDLERRSSRFMQDYMEVTRHLYDYYAPVGRVPWTKRLPAGQIFAPDYTLTVKPYIPNDSVQFPSELNFTFEGKVEMTFTALGELSSIVLNSHRQTINSVAVVVTANNVTNFVDVVRVDRDYKNAIMTIVMATPIPYRAYVRLTVSYMGFVFDQPGEGVMTNWDYLRQDGRKSWIFATDFEGGPSTRSLMPCFDEPSIKGTFQISIIYPGEYTALSNTLDEYTTKLGEGWYKSSFKRTDVMSSYLVALTLGHYSKIQAISKFDKTLVRIWTWTGMEQYGQHALEFAVATVDYLASTLKTSQPLEKFDILALPQYSGYASGAMENWGLVIAGYRDVLWHRDYSPSEDLANVQDTVSHELTHHWFGDLVTMDWWNHIFLNEGFATFWPPRTLAATLPAQSLTSQHTLFNIHEHALQRDSAARSAQPVVPDNSLLTPDYNLFSGAVYLKGASVLGTLFNVFPKQTQFKDALHTYLKSYSYNNPSDSSLWYIMSTAADYYNVPGFGGDKTLDVSRLMRPFTYQWSAPLVRVMARGNGLAIAQSSLVPASQLPNQIENSWVIPYRVIVNGTGNGAIQWLTDVSVEITGTVGNLLSLPIIVNPEAEFHYRVLYDDAMWAPIDNALKANPKLLSGTTKAQLIADTYAHVQAKRTTWDRLLNFTLYLVNENDALPWRFAIDNYISDLTYKFRFHPAYNNLRIYLSYLTKNYATTAAFYPSEDWNLNALRSRVTDLVCMLGDRGCLAKANTKFNDFLNNCANSVDGTGRCNTILPDFRYTELCYGVKQLPMGYQTLSELYFWWNTNPKSNGYFMQDMGAILNALGCVTDTTVIGEVITGALDGTLAPDVLKSVAANDVSGSAMYNYLVQNTNTTLRSPLFNYYLNAMVTSWSSDTQLNNLKNFKWGTSLTSDQQSSVDNAIQTIQSLREWLAGDGLTINNWLQNWAAGN